MSKPVIQIQPGEQASWENPIAHGLTSLWKKKNLMHILKKKKIALYSKVTKSELSI